MSLKYQQGRLIDHVHLRVSDLDASKRFYVAVLEALRLLDGFGEGDGYFYADELFIDVADRQPSSVHVAFQAKDEASVKRFYEAALAAGGRDNGAPGLRSYHATYYAAFVLDPDGNSIEAVWHGQTVRSAESIVVERKTRVEAVESA
jgi:catechol 2,3-dioxygenase-like lactoylglutathione lyase family enzyme